jgi:cytochrome P450
VLSRWGPGGRGNASSWARELSSEEVTESSLEIPVGAWGESRERTRVRAAARAGAGTDTSANTLALLLNELARHPEDAARVREEVRGHVWAWAAVHAPACQRPVRRGTDGEAGERGASGSATLGRWWWAVFRTLYTSAGLRRTTPTTAMGSSSTCACTCGCGSGLQVLRVLAGRPPGELGAADARQLPFTAACVNETLRLYPPGPNLVRVANRV